MTDAAKRKAKVEIFGEELNSDREESFNERFHFRQHHHGSLPFGLALILVGLLFLLSNLGMLPPSVWVQVSRLWPLIIILIGVDTLIGHSLISELINSLIGLFVFATILGIIFLHTSPQIIFGLPQNVQNYLYAINNFLQIK